jgi:3-deoxy-D-manno-octulosonic-acid transferase
MTYCDKFLMQGLSKYCKENYHDFKIFFQELFKNILGIFFQKQSQK